MQNESATVTVSSDETLASDRLSSPPREPYHEVAPGAGQRFQLLDALGAGGQGTTWRALDHQTGREVAVKAFSVDAMDDWKEFDLFEREARVLADLEHPAIPAFIHSWADPDKGRYFLAMELVPGESLARYVEGSGRSLGDHQLEAVLRDSLNALAYMHQRNPPVIHRDLKPANIIQKADERYGIVDFGGVRVALKPGGGSTMVGTFGYIAPEQLYGEATPATDLFSLGVTIAALASGTSGDQLPRQGLTIDVDSVLGGSHLAPLVSRMVEPDPARRPQSAADALALLDDDSAVDAVDLRPLVDSASTTSREPDAAPRFISLLLWMASSFARIGLSVVQYLVMPLLFSLGLGGRRARRDPKRRKALERRKRRLNLGFEKARRALARTALAHDPDMSRSRRSKRRR